jgi:hypothetical protein
MRKNVSRPNKKERERFVSEIQPILQAFNITKIMRACHYSPTYA